MNEVDYALYTEEFHDHPIPVEMSPQQTSEVDTYEPWFLIRNQELKWGD